MNKINGQTSVFLLDLKGKEYPAIAEVNRKKRVNGQREITLSFLYDEINEDFIRDIEFGWKILFKGEWYTIINPSYTLDGDKFSVGVDAVLSFYVDMNGHYLQDEVTDKSLTPASYFTELFKGTGYSYVLVDNLLANTLNYQANQSKTERFLYGIDRFNGEYVIRGKVAYIHGLIGSDKDVILHEDLNIQDVSIEVDGSGFHTFALGFGDKDDSVEGTDYKLKVEYPSPLIAKHGKIEGPAIRDGSFKHKDALIAAVKKQVENSYTVSTTITAIDLTKNGYPEMQFEEGDRAWLYVTQLKQDQQVRVVEIDETFDWEGNIIAAQYVVGNEGIAARYKTQQYDTLKDFRDISSGRKTLEFNWLPDAIRRAADIINGNLDSHFHYGAGEIIGINKSNPNGYMRFNTDGLGFSINGGKNYRNAITYEGIVADAITVGTLRGILIEGVNIHGSRFYSASGKSWMEIIGGDIHLEDANGRKVDINTDGMISRNPDGSIRFEVNRFRVRTNALTAYDSNVYLAPTTGNEVRVVRESNIPGDGFVESYTYQDVRASHFIGEGLVTNSAKGFRNLTLRPRFEDGEVRVFRGTTDLYASARMDGLFASHITLNGLIDNVENLYFRTINEVRVTSTGSIDNYRNMRMDGAYVSHITVNAHTNPDGILYLRAFDEVRITGVDTVNNFRPIRAREFVTDTSIREKKRNIAVYDDDVLGIFRKGNVYLYNRENEISHTKKQLGLMLDEMPYETYSERGDGFGIYGLTGFLFRGIKQNLEITDKSIERLDEMEKRLIKLEGVA